MKRRWERDEDGSIGVVMIIMMITTLLIAATALSVDRGHRVATRHGQSANALQAADAGINYLLRRVPDAPQRTGYSFSCPAGLKLGRASYTCTATFNKSALGQIVWHLDSVSTDIQSGVKRRVRADAVAEPLFQRPLYIRANAGLSSGVSLDSYTNGLSADNKCTKHGVLGISTPSAVNFGSSGGGTGVSNCQRSLNGWTYSIDGCSVYYDTPPAPAIPASLTGPGKCPPPPDTKALTPTPSTRRAEVPAGGTPRRVPSSGTDPGTLRCDAATPLVGNTNYVYRAVELRNGCYVLDHQPGTSVNLYITDTVDIGRSGGANAVINAPPNGAAGVPACGATAQLTGTTDWHYCPGWTTSLIINVVGTASPTVSLNNNQMKFWGAIHAPTAELRVSASGVEIFGAVVTNTLVSNAQFTWHYDDSLTRIGTGRYLLHNWREEPT